MGVAGAIEDIQTVTVNGRALPFEGWLDVGLLDTMLDMLLETLGALAVSVLYLADRGKHPVIAPGNRDCLPPWASCSAFS